MPKPKFTAHRSVTGSNIVFNKDIQDQRWMCYDPGSNIVDKSNRSARGYGGEPDALLLASVVSAFAYLVNECPTTKLACEKLAQLRAAVRMLPEEDEDL